MNQFEHVATFFIGAEIVDLSALQNGWSDVWGKVEEIDGSHLKIRYKSNNVRWKACKNIRLHPGDQNDEL